MTLEQLLVVQAHDSAVDRLTHSRATLPEFDALASLDDEQQHVETQQAALTAELHEIEREQKRHEDEAALVTDRIDMDNERLYSGAVTAHKDLQALQEELATLGERRDGIEELVLEAMEAGDPFREKLAKIDDQLVDIESRRSQINESIDATLAHIDDEIAAEKSQRAEAVASISGELLSEYESSRESNGGVGICKLVDKTCQGCHLSLPAVEYDRVRKEPDGAIIRCGECTRILVR